MTHRFPHEGTVAESHSPTTTPFWGSKNCNNVFILATGRAARSRMDGRVLKLIEYFDRHAGGVQCTLEHACRELKLGISPAYAGQLFKQCTGHGVREFASKQRSLRAAVALATTNEPIKVIAADFGYRQASDFTRFFRKQYLSNPVKFRKRAG